MKGRILRHFLGVSLLLGVGMVWAAQGSDGVVAGELLVNGGFEQWGGGKSTGWNAGAGTTVSEAVGSSGKGVAVSSVSGSGRLVQTVAAMEWATYSGNVMAATSAEGTVTLRVTFLSAGLTPLGTLIDSRVVGTAFEVLTVRGVAPPGSGYVTFALEGNARFDGASLEETAPVVTSTPTSLATPTEELATATPSGGGGGPPSGGTTPRASATSTPQPTTPKLATATKSSTATKTATPSPTKTGTTGTSSYGGLLYNGDFEVSTEGKPDGWAKYGGTFSRAGAAYRGSGAAALSSDSDSTKWVFQTVEVVGGDWYAGSVYVRVEGSGAGFIRLSWYETADGSGTAIEQQDSPVTDASSWTLVRTGAVRAPTGANSLRFRLMVRPDGPVTVSFDDALLAEAEATDEVVAVRVVAGAEASPAADGGTSASVSRLTASGEGGSGLRLSEVMSDPAVTGKDTENEWVELVNIGEVPVDVAGWSLGDAKSKDRLPSAVVPPGGYLVVGAKDVSVPAGVALVRIADGTIGTGLNNTGDAVHLYAPDGREVDAMSYGSDVSVFEPAAPLPGSGKSVGVRDPRGDPSGANWAITDAPSPGMPNRFAVAAAKGTVASATAVGTQSKEAEVRRGEEPSPIPWIVLGGAVAIGVAGGVQGLRAARRKRDS